MPEPRGQRRVARFVPSAEGPALSDTDAEPYIAVELGTNANEQARKRDRPHLTSLSAFNTNGWQCGATRQCAGGWRWLDCLQSWREA